VVKAPGVFFFVPKKTTPGEEGDFFLFSLKGKKKMGEIEKNVGGSALAKLWHSLLSLCPFSRSTCFARVRSPMLFYRLLSPTTTRRKESVGVWKSEVQRCPEQTKETSALVFLLFLCFFFFSIWLLFSPVIGP
jgi:hypothetical protein